MPHLFRKKNVSYTCEKKNCKGASKGFTSEAQMMPKNVSTCRKKRNRVFSELLSLKFIRVAEMKDLEKIKMKLSTLAGFVLTARLNYRKREQQSVPTNLTTAFRKVDLNIKSCLRN